MHEISTAGPPRGGMARIAAASFVGGLLEWYDFYIFASASALIFGELFFPASDQVAGTMAAFGVFAAGFLARPVGGLIFGHIGDIVGRKACLLATMTVIGAGTVLIGLLPTYASWGMWAPAVLTLLRVVQGIGLGGEYGGASLLTIEHAPHHQRGFWGSIAQAASPAGLLLANAVFALVSLLPAEQFHAWGWRVPFLLSALMLPPMILVRLRIAETPEFLAEARAARRHVPVVALWRQARRNLVLATGVRLSETVSSNLIKSFGLTYVTLQLGLPRSLAVGALLAAAVLGLAATPLFGWLGDRVGARRLTQAGNVLLIVLAVPFFLLLEQRSAAAVSTGFAVLFAAGPMLLLSVQPTFFAPLFPAGMRYTGLSAAYQISSILGGFTPLIALWLLHEAEGRPWLVAGFLAGIWATSLLCASLSRPGATQPGFARQDRMGDGGRDRD